MASGFENRGEGLTTFDFDEADAVEDGHLMDGTRYRATIAPIAETVDEFVIAGSVEAATAQARAVAKTRYGWEHVIVHVEPMT